jgi:hypothetical protein
VSWVGALAQWLASLPRPLGIGAGAALIVLATTGAYSAYRGYDYSMHNPAFCRNCHTMEEAWTRWESSEHRDVTCHACHEANILDSAKQVVVFVLRRPQHVGTHAVVPREVCQRCHTSGDERWRQVAATAGHTVHAEARGIQCVVCHAPSIHRFAPPTEVCGACHVAQTTGERRVAIRAMADQHCTECHEFLSLESPLRPGRQTCLGCHQLIPGQVGSWPAGAPMQFPCSGCHKPHERSQPIVACRACHDQPREDIHPASMLQNTPCTACHVPHRWKAGQ